MKEDRGSELKSVSSALEILEFVVMAPSEVGVTDVSEHVGLGKGGVYKHLQTLVAHGYLWQNPETSKYRAGIQCHLLGRHASESVDLVAAAEQPMRMLRDSLGLTVTLAVPKGGKILIVERHFGVKPLEVGIRPGSEFEFHASSQGKIFLAFGKPSMWNLLGKTRESLTKHTITDLDKLRQECELARQQGWIAAPEETIIGINAVSAPVFDVHSNCVAALTIVGSIQYLEKSPTSQQTSRLMEEARAISLQLGYRA